MRHTTSCAISGTERPFVGGLCHLPLAGSRDVQQRQEFVAEIRKKLDSLGLDIPGAVAARHLYFRISATTECNLNCSFCHKEGSVGHASIDPVFARLAMSEAARIGFQRIHFTGGEPLIHPRIFEMVAAARKSFPSVVMTTNGTLIPHSLDKILGSELTEIHISLQIPEISTNCYTNPWTLPTWLVDFAVQARQKNIGVLMNLPLQSDQIGGASEVLSQVRACKCDTRVFSMLADSPQYLERYPILELLELARRENECRKGLGVSGKVIAREYTVPKGIRCASCEAYSRCRDTARTLRLGADSVLRPCLASRRWDVAASADNLAENMEEAALLALDYCWAQG